MGHVANLLRNIFLGGFRYSKTHLLEGSQPLSRGEFPILGIRIAMHNCNLSLRRVNGEKHSIVHSIGKL